MKLLIIEDELSFARVLARRMSKHFEQVEIAESTTEALLKVRQIIPDAVVLDMNIGTDNGVRILPAIRSVIPSARIILLTGYASIATAVAAIRAGADDYLAKPASSDAILHSLGMITRIEETQAVEDLPPLTPQRLEWEHIQQTLKANGGNVSATARVLGMHRRTLQRKLTKKAPL